MSIDITEKSLSKQNRYRPEIDGLRAFAVIAVIINHFNKDILPGGYLGVDIFFVISGFVITSSLYQRPSKNFRDFISRFYVRRIQRLVPALSIFVLITSITICLFNPEPFISLRTGMTSLFGLSNLYLLKQSTDYFAPSTELNAFTHTWSLGVEEQFYIIFPFLIWFSGFGRQKKNGARNLFLIVGALTTISLISFLYLYQTNQPAGYFLMPSRFWEIATGCLIFIIFKKRPSIEKSLKNIPPLLVITFIIGIFYLPMSWGRISTIAIVALSSVLIASFKKGTAAYILFTNPKIIYIGQISYSLYLWHWSILSISRWTIGIHWWSLPFQVALIFCLAITSYRYIETPFRRSNWFKKRWQTIAVSGGVLISLSGGLISFINSNNSLYLGEENGEKQIPYAGNSITRENCVNNPDFRSATKTCWINKENESKSLRRIFFVGDSQNESLSQAAEFLSENIVDPIFIHSSGATLFPVVGQYWKKNGRQGVGIAGRTKNDAIQRIAEDFLLSNIRSGDIIVITLRLPFYFGQNSFHNKEEDFTYKNNNGDKVSRKDFFEQWKEEIFVLASFLEAKNAKIIISSPTPEWYNNFNIHHCRPSQWFNVLAKKNCKIEKILFEREYKSIISFLEKLDQQNKNVYTLDSLSSLCSNDICEYTQNNKELYIDRYHLSNYASRNIIGPILFDLINKM